MFIDLIENNWIFKNMKGHPIRDDRYEKCAMLKIIYC